MNWDSIGQYRCRQCNPDPGVPHDGQTPAQRARSMRYVAAAARSGRRWRCTECGRKLRKTLYTYCMPPWLDDPELRKVLQNVELCADCVGDDRFENGWWGMDIVRM